MIMHHQSKPGCKWLHNSANHSFPHNTLAHKTNLQPAVLFKKYCLDKKPFRQDKAISRYTPSLHCIRVSNHYVYVMKGCQLHKTVGSKRVHTMPPPRSMEQVQSVNADLGHGVMIRFLLRVGPVNNDVALPHLDTSRCQLPLGSRSIFVTVVLEESKPSVLQLGVVSRAIYNDINQALCKKFNETGLVHNLYHTQINVKQWATFHHGVIPEIKAMKTQIEFNSRTKTTNNLMFSFTI